MIISSNKKDMVTEEDEDDEDDNDELIIASKLQLVLAAKSRNVQFTSSLVISHHVSLSLLSSPDDLSSHSRASVPFSWEEEPGKPKHQHVVRAPTYSKRLHLPPRLLLPTEFTKLPLASDHRHRVAGMKRWFRWKKDRADDDDDVAGKRSFVFSSEHGNDTKITRSGGRLPCHSDVTRCYFWQVPWNNKELKTKGL